MWSRKLGRLALFFTPCQTQTHQVSMTEAPPVEYSKTDSQLYSHGVLIYLIKFHKSYCKVFCSWRGEPVKSLSYISLAFIFCFIFMKKKYRKAPSTAGDLRPKKYLQHSAPF